ncbi:pilus assembly protein PilP [Vibrio sp. ZSDZ34]|uniref:Pilus assembly protein PilP n=1 Tax=Vibrio gelatinilyticus TaxID=2893468 RepID=A0A9X1WGE5_9VIBR|nr:pilus assembly protein PilP [Vibrio gelatinilyticus]MCJ2378788.1 pilus assembly protein PilP [Vibrio gelatinilyticus]
MNKYRGVFVLLAAMLAGCRAHQEPLADYFAEVENEVRQEAYSLAIAESNSVVTFAYEPGHLPFNLPAMVPTSVVNNQVNCWQPPTRASQPLEEFAIEQLSLKGIMTKGNARVALIQTPQYGVLKASKGQYLGRNLGKVAAITTQQVVIHEQWPDGEGCWSKRVVYMALQ